MCRDFLRERKPCIFQRSTNFYFSILCTEGVDLDVAGIVAIGNRSSVTCLNPCKQVHGHHLVVQVIDCSSPTTNFKESWVLLLFVLNLDLDTTESQLEEFYSNLNTHFIYAYLLSLMRDPLFNWKDGWIPFLVWSIISLDCISVVSVCLFQAVITLSGAQSLLFVDLHCGWSIRLLYL